MKEELSVGDLGGKAPALALSQEWGCMRENSVSATSAAKLQLWRCLRRGGE